MNDPIVAKAVRMYELAEQIEALKDQTKILQREYDAIRNDELPDIMNTRQIPRITVGQIARSVSLFPMLRASLIDKEEGFAWLRDTGSGALITETVNAQTLAAHVKELLKNGEDVPEEIVKITAWEQARLRKA